MDKIPDSVFDELAQYASKKYFKHLKSNWNKEQYVKNGKIIKWVKLDENYARYKVRNFGELNILVLHGNLLNSFQVDYPKHATFRIWNDAPYAVTHQHGNKKLNVPARPILFDDRKKLEEIIVEYCNTSSNDLKKWVIKQFKK